MSDLTNMREAHAKGDMDRAEAAGIQFLSACLAEASLMKKMRAVVGVSASEGITRSLSTLIITLVLVSAQDREKFDALLAKAREYLNDNEHTAAMWDLFHDYQEEA